MRGPSIPETLMIEPRSRGVLDHPVKPGDDNGVWRHTISHAVRRTRLLRKRDRTFGVVLAHAGTQYSRDVNDRTERLRRTGSSASAEDDNHSRRTLLARNL